MYKIEVTTGTIFETKADLDHYIESGELDKMIGFKTEVEDSLRYKARLLVKETVNEKYKFTACTFVQAGEIEN